jgi:hypothetical protein
MPDSPEEEGRAQRRELSRERWVAHKELHGSEKQLGDQKWDAHAEQHASIAHNLTEYKAQSNEWRGALSDLRSNFLSRIEYDAAHKSLEATVESLEKALANEREERRDQQNLRTGQEEGISRTAAIVVTAIGIVGTLLGGFAVLLNVLK